MVQFQLQPYMSVDFKILFIPQALIDENSTLLQTVCFVPIYGLAQYTSVQDDTSWRSLVYDTPSADTERS